ncbi:hypothetical protein GIB67_035487 [Kingdonia uniflora]|uniref:Uncharacterized protein n=1 Tax=Kingdonia uniflora TaxID=39325 RepID=A0A7J7P0R0_9MAGN|nr:hypothetical protein GIB67_035487 [Kingdonia uniflora]
METCFVSLPNPNPPINPFHSSPSNSISRASFSQSRSLARRLVWLRFNIICNRVRAIGNLPKDTLVTIELNDVDDWEVLDLNVELAEDAILKQAKPIETVVTLTLQRHDLTSPVVTSLKGLQGRSPIPQDQRFDAMISERGQWEIARKASEERAISFGDMQRHI